MVNVLNRYERTKFQIPLKQNSPIKEFENVGRTTNG
jgi:hypothetical protein